MVKRYNWRHPRGYIYVRKGGKLIGRITAPDGTPDFDRQYWEFLTGKKATARTSWKALIEDYRRSDHWIGLKSRTRADYEAVLSYLLEKNGAKDMTRVTRADAIAAQRANAHRIRFANYIAQVLSILCERAVDLGWIKGIPIKGTRHLKTPNHRKKQHMPWPDSAVQK
ncbi:MAG: hypothetical protein Q4F71_04720 [Paracoccus sp. (in: a-proteobacteria)]|nr:hypothetical protein [Paracoccus sp. (in: a-proteobacteria)]